MACRGSGVRVPSAPPEHPVESQDSAEVVRTNKVWGCGAAGSAPAWHAGGQGFESPQLHQTWKRNHPATDGSSFLYPGPSEPAGTSQGRLVSTRTPHQDLVDTGQ